VTRPFVWGNCHKCLLEFERRLAMPLKGDLSALFPPIKHGTVVRTILPATVLKVTPATSVHPWNTFLYVSKISTKLDTHNKSIDWNKRISNAHRNHDDCNTDTLHLAFERFDGVLDASIGAAAHILI
jgi:hypothetical protein